MIQRLVPKSPMFWKNKNKTNEGWGCGSEQGPLKCYFSSLPIDPVVKVPVNVADGPTFLPDPKDGTLYALGGGTEGLKVSRDILLLSLFFNKFVVDRSSYSEKHFQFSMILM